MGRPLRRGNHAGRARGTARHRTLTGGTVGGGPVVADRDRGTDGTRRGPGGVRARVAAGPGARGSVGLDHGQPGMTANSERTRPAVRAVAHNVLDELVLLALAGISTGVVVAGIGSRLAML